MTILKSPCTWAASRSGSSCLLVNTLAYYMQAQVISDANLDSASRTQIFGAIDLATNILIPLTQILITGVLASARGSASTLAIAAATPSSPGACRHAGPRRGDRGAGRLSRRLLRPVQPGARGLWPVVDRADKYKTKNVVDNVALFRGGDVANS